MRKAQTTQLASHVGNIFFGRYTRVLTGLNGELLGRKTESVVSHCVKNIFAAHAVETSNRISRDIAEWVPNMKTLT